MRIASHVVQDQPGPLLREERTREEHLDRLGVEGERGARDRSHQMRELATRPRQLGGQRGPSPFAAQRLRETPRRSVGVARRASPVLGADVRRPERRELADGARPEGAQVHRGAQLQPGQAEAAREQPPRPPRVSQHAPHQVLRGLPTHLVQVVDEHEGARRVGEVDGARELLVGLAQPHQRVLGGVPSGAREGAQDRVVEIGRGRLEAHEERPLGARVRHRQRERRLPVAGGPLDYRGGADAEGARDPRLLLVSADEHGRRVRYAQRERERHAAKDYCGGCKPAKRTSTDIAPRWPRARRSVGWAAEIWRCHEPHHVVSRALGRPRRLRRLTAPSRMEDCPPPTAGARRRRADEPDAPERPRARSRSAGPARRASTATWRC